MSSRVAVKAALLALAFMLVILAISAYSLSVDRNGELTESLAFGCTVASGLLESAGGDAQRVAILETLPDDAKMAIAYFDADGASLYDNRPGQGAFDRAGDRPACTRAGGRDRLLYERCGRGALRALRVFGRRMPAHFPSWRYGVHGIQGTPADLCP